MSALPSPGRLLANKYRLLERVGVGGMSEVYRAETVGTGSVVAVKLVLPHKLEDPSFVARLFQEAHSGLRIRHPGIVQVHEAGQSDLGPFLVMDYLLGESAGRRLYDHGPFSVPAAVATLLPVLDALQAAHDAGVVHRDIKPSNIFYAVQGPREVHIKLLDFGVAKLLWPAGGAPRTSTGVVMGTPDYLSPEQASGEAELDGRSDLFAVGIVLFELLTGKRPFHAPSAVATAFKVAHQRTPRLSERGGPRDPTLQAILDRALAKVPGERYGSAREMAEELQSVGPPRLVHESVLCQLVKPERFCPRERSASGERPVTPPHVLDQLKADAGLARPSPVSTPPPMEPLEARARAADKQVRGVVLRTIDQYTREVFGDYVRLRALQRLPKEVATELEYQALQAIVMYDVKALNAYFEGVTNEGAVGSAVWARSAGARAVSGELGAFMRNALRPGDVVSLLRRSTVVLSRLFSFGTWEVVEKDDTITLRIGDMGALNAPARLWLVGVVDGALQTAGVRARATIVRGDAAHAPLISVEVTVS